MALIPPDAGIRMRMQTESSLVQPLGPVKGIPADLPDLQIGQAFTARIQEALPDNVYKALVAGRQLTLQLPEGAAPGDSLDLVLIDRTPKTLIAQRTEGAAAPAGANQPYQFSRISDAGKMIGQLLLAEGEAPQPAPLNRGQPLLAQPPANAASLAPTLAKAVSESGLFYEAHQAQWLAGQRPIESLRAEPQGQLPALSRPSQTLPGLATNPLTTPALAQSAEQGMESADRLTYQIHTEPKGATPESPANQPASALPASQAAATGKQEAILAQATGDSRTTGNAPANSPTTPNINVPDEVRPLVQQQLDAVATQRLSWHGEVWPGQVMDWEIERERTEERDAAKGTDDQAPWSTTLRLTMPQLGTVDATLQLTGGRLRLRMASSSDDAAASLRRQTPALVQALTDAGLALQSLEIRHEA